MEPGEDTVQLMKAVEDGPVSFALMISEIRREAAFYYHMAATYRHRLLIIGGPESNPDATEDLARKIRAALVEAETKGDVCVSMAHKLGHVAGLQVKAERVPISELQTK